MAKTQNTKVIDAILSSTGSKTPSSPRRSRRVKGFGQKAAGSNSKGSLPELVMTAADVAALESESGQGKPAGRNAGERRSTAKAGGDKRRTRRTTGGKTGREEAPRETFTPEAEYDLVQAPRRGRSRNTAGKNSGRGEKKPALKIIPLGGLNEIGKNLTVYEYGRIS